jgi:hypothetical protein
MTLAHAAWFDCIAWMLLAIFSNLCKFVYPHPSFNEVDFDCLSIKSYLCNLN